MSSSLNYVYGQVASPRWGTELKDRRFLEQILLEQTLRTQGLMSAFVVEQARTKVYEQRQVAHLPFRPSGWQFRTRVIGSAPLTSEMKNAQDMLCVAEVSGLE